ncbi:hypothetical protein Ddye_000672 [Dipteronia dyeriana]|uniref:CCHC-type domain-containing protein n=1 Tax=Dipteronia dyeriana TaxID=168575 RepID=A0AAE0CTA9_9ROSI|nr:hypothetical protein Ddye_000672 [Dipteronia dyeriana]
MGVNPVPDPELLDIPDAIHNRIILPWEKRNLSGRPKKSRILSVVEKRKLHSCSKCGKKGRKKTTCPKPSSNTNKPAKKAQSCSICKKEGHSKLKCPDKPHKPILIDMDKEKVDGPANEDTIVPTTLVQRGWQNFVSVLADANVSLVKEFYASMIPEPVKKGSVVFVRDIPFMINATKINAHFGTSNYPQFRKGYRSRHNTKSSLVMALRGTYDSVWEHGHLLKQSELPQELAFWNLFNTFSLLPTTHGTTVSKPRADLLSCIQDQTKIDIGQVIMKAILEATLINMHPQVKPGSMIFPSLITVLLKKEEVPEITIDEIKINPMGDLNK